jgi:hypothetical protein
VGEGSVKGDGDNGEYSQSTLCEYMEIEIMKPIKIVKKKGNKKVI